MALVYSANEMEVIRESFRLYVWAAVSSFRGCDSRDTRGCFGSSCRDEFSSRDLHPQQLTHWKARVFSNPGLFCAVNPHLTWPFAPFLVRFWIVTSEF
jgi:hypothetical protein